MIWMETKQLRVNGDLSAAITILNIIAHPLPESKVVSGGKERIIAPCVLATVIE
jgi:hypothetical protein